jgi:hypothetical protein
VIGRGRDVDVRDVRVREEDQQIVARPEPYPALDGFDTQDVESFPRVRHDLDAHIRIVVFPAARSNHLGEVLTEERHVEHNGSKVTQNERRAYLGAYVRSGRPRLAGTFELTRKTRHLRHT